MDRDKLYLAVVEASINAMPTHQRVRTFRLIQEVLAVLDTCPDQDARAAAIAMVAAENLVNLTTPNDPT